MDRDVDVAPLRAAFPTLTTRQLEHALERCDAEVASIEDILSHSNFGFFEYVANSVIGGAPSIPLSESLPGLDVAADAIVPYGTFSARPHNVLRRLRQGGPYTWGDIGSRSPNQLLTLTNLGMTSATEIVRVCARMSVSAFSLVTADRQHEPGIDPASTTLTAPVPDSVRYPFATLATWLEVATDTDTLGEGIRLVLEHRESLPDDVARAWTVISETRLTDIADAAALNLPERLRQLDTALGEERSRKIFWARIDIESPTLDSLAAPLGLTRERVRQLQVKAESAAELVLAQPELAAVRWQAAKVRRMLGVGFPESASWASALLDDAANQGGAEWHERLRSLLLWVAGPYRRNEDGWLVRGEIPSREALRGEIDDAQRVDIEKLEAALVTGGLAPAAVNEWLDRHLPVRRIGDEVFVWEGSVADKAYVLLNAWGRPASAEAIAHAVGEGHVVRSTRTRLLEDTRFKRVDRVRIGLRSWPFDEYTGIVDELAQELEARGGESETHDLVMTVAHNYDLKVTSVEAYTGAPRFVIDGSRIRLRGIDEPYQPRRKLTDEARCYLVSDAECTYRMLIDRDVLRGSGRPIPEGLGSWLGVLPGTRREFAFGDDLVPVTWPDSSFMGPSIGSVRRTIISLDGCEGDQLLLRFDRGTATGTAELIRPNDLVVDSPERRTAVLTGLVVDGSVIDAVARAVGSPAPSVKERLRKRGETDLLEIVSSASFHLDTALDRLRDVL